MTTEKDLRNEIVLALRKIGAKVIVFNIGPFTPVGEPDLIGCYEGFAFALEVKRESQPAEHTRRQKTRMREWRRAGARCGVVRTVAQALRTVRAGARRRNDKQRLRGVAL